MIDLLETFKKRMSSYGHTEGEARIIQSRKILEGSWDRDTATRNVYVKWVDRGLPEILDEDMPLRAKFNAKSYHNITGDEIAYLLQFRQQDIQTNENIKIGSYVYIQNEFDEYEWWIIVHFDDRPQFRQFSILKCNWVYKWISNLDGKRQIHECLGAARKQNSYNSGVWLDYVFQTAENQTIYFTPTNQDTKTIMYDTRFLFSDPIRPYPLAWKVSKIESAIPPGLTRFTMTQDMYDPQRDNQELMLADYYSYEILPTVESDEPETVPEVRIYCSGKSTVRAGGSYKTFRAQQVLEESYTDIESDVMWAIDMPEEDLDKFDIVTDQGVLKIKCAYYDMIGKVFTVIMVHGNSTASMDVEVISL